MTAPKISVFLPSYNKGEYVLDAMRSVFAQTRTDWELWILENSNDGETHKLVEAELDYWKALPNKIHYERLEGEEIEKTRRAKYITAWLLNVYYPEANGEYIFYLSDDDLIDANCFELMAGELDASPDRYVVYAGLRLHGPAPTGRRGRDHEPDPRPGHQDVPRYGGLQARWRSGDASQGVPGPPGAAVLRGDQPRAHGQPLRRHFPGAPGRPLPVLPDRPLPHYTPPD